MADAPLLADRTAIVTGAGNGIGRAIALAFANAGASVGCVDVVGEHAEATAKAITTMGGRAIAIRCDVSSEKDTAAAASTVRGMWEHVHILVNAAAAYDSHGTVLEISPTDWDRVFAVNVKGAYLMSRAVLPAMVAAGGGSIIHIASQLGRVAAPGRAPYCASKGAIIQLAKVMAADHAGQNIRVNALSPGAIETGRLLRRHGTMAAAREALGPKHLLGRLGQADEIAQAALFLASDSASFVTGSDMLVDGGYTAV
jgi:NAD(P)-dependent dehydrogenase (short-subunit alcohol dehydrogenase family)